MADTTTIPQPRAFAILGDSPADAASDWLNFGQFVRPLAERLVASVENTPFTVGVMADWGQGKSTVMRLLRAALEAERCPTVWFDPWKYNGREAVWKGLALTLVSEIRRSHSLMAEIRRKRRSLTRFSAKWLWGRLIGREWAQDLVDAVESEPWSPALLHDFEQQFSTLFELIDPRGKDSTARPLVLFVDDLDRCLPDAALAVMEALQLVLNRPGLITVMGIAERELGYAVAAAYAKAMQGLGVEVDRQWGARYIRKIIQMPFPLPVISESSFDDYIARCLASSRVGPRLHAESRSSALDAERFRWHRIIRDTCGANLREVKRFINHFISEMDKASANYAVLQPQGGLEAERVAFVLLLGWRFGDFLAHIRRRASERDLLIRYQLFFAQRSKGATPDPSLLDGEDDTYRNDLMLQSFFNDCFSNPPLLVPFSWWQELEPYLQFGTRSVYGPPPLTPAAAPGTVTVPAASAVVDPPAAPVVTGPVTAPTPSAVPVAPPPPAPASSSGPAPQEAAGSPAAPPPSSPPLPQKVSTQLEDIVARTQELLSAGRLDEALKAVESAMPLAARLDDRAGAAILWGVKGHIEQSRGQIDEARKAYEIALKRTSELPIDARQIRAELSILIALSSLEREASRMGRARDLAEAAVRRAHDAQDSIGEMNALTELGSVRQAEGLPTEATSRFREALAMARKLGHQPVELLLIEKLLDLSPLSSEKPALVLRAHELATELGDRKALDRLSQYQYS
jgi:tetratricopeptide (TPR) repeat protein